MSVKVALAGIGNCVSSLVQGVEYYRGAEDDAQVPGLMHVRLGGYHVSDLEFVAAFEVDAEKVGSDLSEAIWAGHNNTIKFSDVPNLGVEVLRGPTHDGLGEYYRTYQLNVGGNMDFKNMLERSASSRRRSRRLAFVRLEGRGFGDVPMSLEYKLEVWDSPNSAGTMIDAIRSAKVALDQGLSGPVEAASAYFMKSPPVQKPDDVARTELEEFLAR